MNRAIATDRRPALSRGYRFQWEPSQGCYVLLFPEGMITLNESAGAILRHCDASHTVGDIVARLQSEFPGAELEADVLDFLEDAHERGWIEAR